MNLNSYKSKIFVFFRKFCHKNIQFIPFRPEICGNKYKFWEIFNLTKVEF